MTQSNSLLERPVIEDAHNERSPWQAYWDGLSERRRQLFCEQASEYVLRLESALSLKSMRCVLDFGCGFGFAAEMLARRVDQVYLWDASENMRRYALVNVAGRHNIQFVDLSDAKAVPRDLRFDLILVNSVVQYMSRDEFAVRLFQWRSMLARHGWIVVSDLIPPNYQSAWDIVDLLKFSAAHGLLMRSIWQAMGDVKRHWRISRAYPLCRIGREELDRWGKAAGLAVSYLPSNLTHLTRRITAVFSENPAV